MGVISFEDPLQANLQSADRERERERERESKDQLVGKMLFMAKILSSKAQLVT